MAKPLPITLWEDYQVWEKFGTSDLRWTFNKLEIALRGGLHAGPAGVAPTHQGLYISRPIYNLYGMGIGAEQFSYQPHMYESMIHHAKVPPGHFWCEWIPGTQLSIDYQKYDNGTWEISSVWEGTHHTDNNLTKYRNWTRLSNRAAPPTHQLPLQMDWLHDNSINFFNIEMRNNHITEIHLRAGDYKFRDLPVGTSLYPVWKGDEATLPQGEYLPATDTNVAKYEAHGHTKEIRDGFIIVRDQHQ